MSVWDERNSALWYSHTPRTTLSHFGILPRSSVIMWRIASELRDLCAGYLRIETAPSHPPYHKLTRYSKACLIPKLNSIAPLHQVNFLSFCLPGLSGPHNPWFQCETVRHSQNNAYGVEKTELRVPIKKFDCRSVTK